MKKLSLIMLMVFGSLVSWANGQGCFDEWPEGSEPRAVGKKVAERFLSRPHSTFGKFVSVPSFITYPDTCTWYGSLKFAGVSGDEPLVELLVKRFAPLLGSDSKLVPGAGHVDTSVFGGLPLEIYMQKKDEKCLEIGKGIADKQWENPREDGLSSETRFWIDDMYMITLVQVQAFRATGEQKYIDRAAKEMVAYLDRLQQENGLFYHAPESKFYWGRGNGWVAAGMTELLISLPMEHESRGRIMEGYKKMMAGLVKYQGEDGMWNQLIDNDKSWSESSSTGMFTFAMVSGVKHGWLDEGVYGQAARKGWLGLVSCINENSDVKNVCEGTGKGNSVEYYLNRDKLTGDLHGQAPVLWCASALLSIESGVARFIEVDVSDAMDVKDWAYKARDMAEKYYPVICEELRSEGHKAPDKVKLLFKNSFDGIAYASGNVITINADWVRKRPNDWGMVIHELTHVVQHYPRYQPFWLTEGIADYVRYVMFEPQSNRFRGFKADSVDYKRGYAESAAFLEWMVNTQDKEIVTKLSAALREKRYKDELLKEYTGKTLDELWQGYLEDLRKKNG